MSGQERRAVRQFEDELKRGGWRYVDTDGGRTVWSHPRAGAHTFRLPVAPRHFDIQRARRDIARLLGQPTRKRSGKGKPKRQRQDFVMVQAKKQAADPEPTMKHPVRCRHCGHVHDAAKVTVEARYVDCSVWRCPRCKTQIDDRPHAWGGSERVTVTPPRRTTSRHLPWEGQDEDYDRGIDQLMRQAPGGRR